MPAFDSLQRCGFDGVQFPIKSISIKGRYRYHEHEYLRVPGAIIEKLERAVYSIEIDAIFDTNQRGYGQLWPNGIAALRKKYEEGKTGPLVIPTLGTIPAFQPEWDEKIDIARVRSGETARLVFKEDQTARFLRLAVAQSQQQSMATATANLAAMRAQIAEPANDVSIFDQIENAANSILSIKDQSDLYGGLMAQKLTSFTTLMTLADLQLQSLKQPSNYQMLDAFLELWNAGVVMSTNLAESPRGPRTYVTPRQMSVGDIATAVYGGSERASEILMNNNLPDAFAVPAGEKVVYFEDAGLAA